MAQPGVVEQPPRRPRIVVRDQNAACENAYRTLEHTHVAIEYDMMDSGAVEQRAHRRHQHRIVCSDQFPHVLTVC